MTPAKLTGLQMASVVASSRSPVAEAMLFGVACSMGVFLTRKGGVVA